MTGADLGFAKVLSYREVHGWPLSDWPDKVEVFRSLPISGSGNGGTGASWAQIGNLGRGPSYESLRPGGRR